MPKTKSKMISIRVSPDDYELLKQEHTTRGTRSISDFAREALHHIIQGPPAMHLDVHAELRSLDTKVATLQSEVTQLSRIVAEGLLSRIKP